MATKASGVSYHLQPIRRKSLHIVAPVNLDAASGTLSPSDSNKNLSATSDSDGYKIQEKKVVETLFSEEDESEDDESSVDGPAYSTLSKESATRSSSFASPRESSTAGNQERQRNSDKEHSRRWYHFNLPILLPLISPLGHWFLGTDYVKNFLLIALLIFYLHQIIEAPWHLYLKARARNSPIDLPSSSSESEVTVQEKQQKKLAISELRFFELFFLLTTIISPFLGAQFLRYATLLFLGPDAVSWFSITLFVFATGIRPWSHLIDRLHQRTTDLHDSIHYPPSQLPGTAAVEQMQAKNEVLEKRVAHLERALVKVKNQVTDSTEEVYDYVDEAVETVDRNVRKQDRRCEKQEARMNEVEQSVEVLKGKGKGRQQFRHPLYQVNKQKKDSSFFLHLLPWRFFFKKSVPKTFSNRPHFPSSDPLRPYPSASSSLYLETIPEEEELPQKYPNQQHHEFSFPLELSSLVFSGIGFMMMLPLRVAARLILGRF